LLGWGGRRSSSMASRCRHTSAIIAFLTFSSLALDAGIGVHGKSATLAVSYHVVTGTIEENRLELKLLLT
jgi:hypothetical protein